MAGEATGGTEPPPRPVTGDRMDLAVALRALRSWTGLSLQALEDKNKTLTHTRTGEHLLGKRMPDWEWLTTFVTVCLVHRGLSQQDVARELAVWQSAWRHAQRIELQRDTTHPRAPAPEQSEAPARDDGPETAIHTVHRSWWTRRRVVAAAIAGALVAGSTYLVEARPWSTVGVCGPTVEHEYSSYAYRFTPCWAGGTTVVWFRDMEGDGYCVIGQVTFQQRTGFGTLKPLPPRACPATDEKGKRVELRSPIDSTGAEVSFALAADTNALLSPAPAAPTSASACPLTVVPLPSSVNPGLRVVLFADTGCPLWQAGYGCPDDPGRDVWQLPTHIAQASRAYRLDFANHSCTVKIFDHPDGSGKGCTLSAGSTLPLADAVKRKAFSVAVYRDPQDQKC